MDNIEPNLRCIITYKKKFRLFLFPRCWASFDPNSTSAAFSSKKPAWTWEMWVDPSKLEEENCIIFRRTELTEEVTRLRLQTTKSIRTVTLEATTTRSIMAKPLEISSTRNLEWVYRCELWISAEQFGSTLHSQRSSCRFVWAICRSTNSKIVNPHRSALIRADRHKLRWVVKSLKSVIISF